MRSDPNPASDTPEIIPLAEIKRYARNKQINLIIVGEQGFAAERDYEQRLCDDAPCAVMTLFIPPPRGDEEKSHPASLGVARRT